MTINLQLAKYARGFLIQKTPIEFNISALGVEWAEIRFGIQDEFHCFYDPRNSVISVKKDDIFCFILGIVVDTKNWKQDLGLIANNICQKAINKEELYNYIDYLAGRYIIIFGSKKEALLIQDACGMRSCYYSSKLISSHYNIIGRLENKAEHFFWKTYQGFTRKPWYLPGDITPWQGVLTLLPNHELHLTNHSVHRFFPRENRKKINPDLIIDEFSYSLIKQCEILSKRYSLFTSLTGGVDSRVTLSALRSLAHNVLFYTYNNGSKTDGNELDNQISQYLCKLFNLNLKNITLNGNLPEGFREIYHENHYHEHVLHAIPKYLEHLPCDGGLHLRSNILEIIRHRDYFRPNANSSLSLNENTYGYYGLDKIDHVQDLFDEFYIRNEYEKLFNYDVGDIFYMEYRMGVWHSGGVLLGTDIAFDTYCLFNCRRLIEIGLALPKYLKENNFLANSVIKNNWPELFASIPNTNIFAGDISLLENYKKDCFEISNNKQLNTGISLVRRKDSIEAILYSLSSIRGEESIFTITFAQFWRPRKVRFSISCETNLPIQNNTCINIKIGDLNIECFGRDIFSNTKNIEFNISAKESLSLSISISPVLDTAEADASILIRINNIFIINN